MVPETVPQQSRRRIGSWRSIGAVSTRPWMVLVLATSHRYRWPKAVPEGTTALGLHKQLLNRTSGCCDSLCLGDFGCPSIRYLGAAFDLHYWWDHRRKPDILARQHSDRTTKTQWKRTDTHAASRYFDKSHSSR